jgi:type III pantothenate kinase
MNLLIDIGNTRLKWATQHNGQWQSQAALAHQETDWERLLRLQWQELPPPEKVVISCVAAHTVVAVVTVLAQHLWPSIEIVKPQSVAEGFGVKNAYQQPEKLGIDRWLGLIAARHFYQTPAWVIDCGTALTVDFIDKFGNHTGGVIAPGLSLMKKALTDNTAALPFSSQSYPLQLATDTRAGIFSGTLYAAVGLIEQLAAHQASPAVLLLTGGDAEVIRPHLSCIAIVDPDLVLKGLAVIAASL